MRAACPAPRSAAAGTPWLQRRLAIGASNDPLEHEADRAADSALRGQVPALRPTAPRLSRRTTEQAGAAAAPPSVQASLQSPGEALPPALRADMGARFAHDFGQVRVHRDAAAARSAQEVGALAYTVGTHIVFDAGQYAPHSAPGRGLLAHELAHVVQQAGAPTAALQRQTAPRPAPVDADAQRIIDLAQDSARPIAERAVAVVQAIIDQYYASDAAKVSRIRYRAEVSGLHITYAGRGAATTGQIEVGSYFVENTTTRHFARRVAQVRHEIEHVEQQRSGMTGESRQDEREFMAFYHEALFTEPAGTGRMQQSTRVTLIDGALGYWYCLSADLQRDNQSRKDELLERRAAAVRSGRTSAGDPPTSCRRQAD